MPWSAVSATALAVLLLAVHGHTAAQAVPCDALQASIEAKIRGKGVEHFAVRVVEAASSAEGRVVGTCERGAKKLIYVRTPEARSAPGQPRAAGAASATSPAQAPSKPPPVITECADGRVLTRGSCTKP
jgi:Protein of unknown function (DUF1161)